MISIWCAFLAIAALTYAAAFREPKRTALQRPLERTPRPPQASHPEVPPVEAASARAAAETWSALAPHPKLRVEFLPPDTPAFSAMQVALGARLFSEPWFEGSEARSCATCHVPGWGFGSGRADGIPALWDHAGDSAYRAPDGWTRFEARVARAIESDSELGASSLAAGWNALRGRAELAERFARAFEGDAQDAQLAVRALALFLAVQRSGKSAWDRAEAGEREALTELQLEGQTLFFGDAGCASCHAAPSFAGADAPSLRDLEARPPFGKDGHWSTLREVLRDHAPPDLRDGKPRDALEAFLRSLGGDRPMPFLPADAPSPSR